MAHEIITYVNWAMIDDNHKNGDKSMSRDVEYCDFYWWNELNDKTRNRIDPFMTMYRTNNKAANGRLLLNKDGAYDYYYCGEVVSGHAEDAVRKYLIGTRKTGDYALYINEASGDNLLFNGSISVLDIK